MQSDLERSGRLGELLRGLPQEARAPYNFAEFTRRIEQGKRGKRSQVLAAAAVVAVAVIALSLRLAATLPSGGGMVQLPSGAAEAPDTAPAQSAGAERDSALLTQEPAVARLGPRAAVIRLEDRIAQLDDLLSAAQAAQDAPPTVQALQQERRRVFGTLLQVQSAEAVADESL
jgi:hypothetical protein